MNHVSALKESQLWVRTLATSDAQIREAEGLLQVAVDEYKMKSQLLKTDAVARREVERLASMIDSGAGQDARASRCFWCWPTIHAAKGRRGQHHDTTGWHPCSHRRGEGHADCGFRSDRAQVMRNGMIAEAYRKAVCHHSIGRD